MKNFFLFCSFYLILVSSSCTKKSSAGLGGNNTLILKAQHHGVDIDSCTIHIKFNSQDAPSDNVYDLTKTVMLDTILNEFVVRIGNLKTGEYYLYGYGWDPFIVENVKGGLPIKINADNTTTRYAIPVTED